MYNLPLEEKTLYYQIKKKLQKVKLMGPNIRRKITIIGLLIIIIENK